jgi:hypothetical protein
MPGDLSQDVDRNACVSHSSQACMPEIVTPQMLIAELGDNLIPRRRVTQHSSGDAATTRANEKTPPGCPRH